MKTILYLAAAMHIALCAALLPGWLTIAITGGMLFARYKLLDKLFDSDPGVSEAKA